jgi:hypothetical protein
MYKFSMVALHVISNNIMAPAQKRLATSDVGYDRPISAWNGNTHEGVEVWLHAPAT